VWESRRLTTLWASIASYRDSFSFVTVGLLVYRDNVLIQATGIAFPTLIMNDPY
jgi:hypothetical protein